jgi:curved DNA-binding protein CbpA
MNPYKILELSYDASTEDIKRAFRHHAKASHPDLNKRDPNASARFKKVAEAYTILSDPIKKKRVDDFILGNHNNSYDTEIPFADEHTFNNEEGKYSAQQIGILVRELQKQVQPYKSAAMKSVLKGLAWLGLGILVTVFSYNSARDTGGVYFVMFGAVIFGAIQAIRSFVAYSRIKKEVKRVESELLSHIFSNENHNKSHDV